MNIMKTAVLLALIFVGMTGLPASGGDNQKPFELTTLLGETFHGCRIIKATPESITVSHESGVSRIPFENLNDEWKNRFHYSPEKASAFQKEEAARRSLAEEKRRQAQKDLEKANSRQMAERVAAEGRWLLKLQEAIVQQQVEAATAAAFAAPTQPGLRVPAPGDPTPYFRAGLLASRSPTAGGAALQSAADVLIPATTPIGQVYTPEGTPSQRYIINQGTLFTPGDGTIYYGTSGYYGGYYGTPGCAIPPGTVYPPATLHPPTIVCPPSTFRPFPLLPGGGVTIRPGSGGFRPVR